MKQCMLAMLGALCLIGAARADDATEFQAFSLSNQTRESITYQVRWGGGRWKEYTLAPGAALRHFMPDFTDSPAPLPQIRIGGRVYNPVTNRVQDRRDAYRYYFRAAGGTVNLSAR